MDFQEKTKYFQDCIKCYLDKIIPKQHEYINTILDSMRYSILAGGKRLRPILMMGVGELYECCMEDILPYAAGIEMIHTYSLIHDDLPGMDNDDYRRGRLTNHKVYGEGIAILAGDALLNFAFEHMLEYAYKRNEMKYVKAALEIAHASGINGMIGGQVVDLECENKKVNIEVLNFMHNNKTGALITASVKAGAIVSNASSEDLKRLTDYAHDLGLAFQIVDDILDMIGDEKKLGKKTGSDSKNSKATYISMVGMDNAKLTAKKLTSNALNQIMYYGERSEYLCQLTEYLLNREY